MHVDELYALTLWADKEIRNKNVPQKYQALLKILQQNTKPNQPKQPFEAQKEDLLQTLRAINVSDLNESQKSFMRELGLLDLVGEEGAKNIEQILYINALDIATATQKINQLLQQLNSALQKLQQIKSGLDGYVKIETELKDKALIRVYFENEASIKNITNLKEWSSVWFEIGRGVAMLHESPPEEIEVIGASRGSLIIELATTYFIARTISRIIIEILNIVEKILFLKQKAEEIKSIQLANQHQENLIKLSSQLSKQADEIKETEIENLVDSVLEAEGKAEKKDIINDLRKSIKNLFNFFEKGGDVDLTIPDSEFDEDDESLDQLDQPRDELVMELKQKVKELHGLKNKIKMLENKIDS